MAISKEYAKAQREKLEAKKKAALRKVEKEIATNIKQSHDNYKVLRENIDKDDKKYKTKINDLNARQKAQIKNYENAKKEALKNVESEFKAKLNKLK